MFKKHAAFIAVNRKAKTYLLFCEVLDGVWKGAVRLPRSMEITRNSHSSLVVRVDRGAFAIEHDSLAILTLPPLGLVKPFLIPAKQVLLLELRRKATHLDVFAICGDAKTVSVDEAKRLNSRRPTPPGIFNSGTLTATDRPHIVQGGLPSLGRRN